MNRKHAGTYGTQENARKNARKTIDNNDLLI